MRTYTFDAEASANLLDLMGHPGRLTVLKLIAEKEWDVGSLAQQVGLSQSALSQHLAKLRAGKLVETRRDRQTVYYSSQSDAVRKVLATLEKLALEPVRSKRANGTQAA